MNADDIIRSHQEWIAERIATNVREIAELRAELADNPKQYRSLRRLNFCMLRRRQRDLARIANDIIRKGATA
jgi:hypothetical protein